MRRPFVKTFAIDDLLCKSEQFAQPALYVRSYGTVASTDPTITDHGDPFTVGSVANCCAALQSSGGGSVILSGPYTYHFQTAYTVPALVTLVVQGGAKFKFTGAGKLISKQPIMAPEMVLFDPSGFYYLYTMHYNAAWFGFNPSNSNGNVSALIKACAIAEVADEEVQGTELYRSMVDLYIPPGHYDMDYSAYTYQTIPVGANTQIRGLGSLTTVLESTDSDIPFTTPHAFFTGTATAASMSFTGFAMVGSTREDGLNMPFLTYGGGLRIPNAVMVHIKDVSFVGLRGYGVYIGDGGIVTPNSVTINDNSFIGVATQQHKTIPVGIITSAGAQLDISNNSFVAVTKGIAIATQVNWNSWIIGAQITSNNMSNIRRTDAVGTYRLDYPTLELTGIYVGLSPTTYAVQVAGLNIQGNLLMGVGDNMVTVDHGGISIVDSSYPGKVQGAIISNNNIYGLARGVTLVGVNNSAINNNHVHDTRGAGVPEAYAISLVDCNRCVVNGNIAIGGLYLASILDKNINKNDNTVDVGEANRYFGNVPAISGIPLIYDRTVGGVIHRVFFTERSTQGVLVNSTGLNVEAGDVIAGPPAGTPTKHVLVKDESGGSVGYIPIY